MLLSTGFCAPGKVFVMSFMTKAYWAAMMVRSSKRVSLPARLVAQRGTGKRGIGRQPLAGGEAADRFCPMRNKLRAAALVSAVLALAPQSANAAPDTVAWDIVEGLTTEVGQRLAGSEAEARARAWAEGRLTALGFRNVTVEPFMMPAWVRGVER